MAYLLFWFHPLVYILGRELGQAREEVCDNVASQEEGAACYARTLLAIAQGRDPAPHITSVLALQGPESSLEKRVTGLLNPRRNRMVRMNRVKQLVVTGAMAVVLASASTVQVMAQGKSDDPKKGMLPIVVQSVQIRKIGDHQIMVLVDGKSIGPVHFVYKNAENNGDKQKAK